MSVSVSIIVPCYNVAAYLDQCMESLAGQSMEDIEIICVNDGSSDHTAEILREWRDRDGRVRVIDRKNSGVSAARNSGMEAAAGKYIGFVDPDDVVDRNMFRRLFDAAVEKDADVAVCGYHEFCDRGGMDMPESGWSPSAGFFPEEKAERFRRGTPWSQCAGTVWNKLIRRELLLENDIRFGEEFAICEDMAFSMQVLEKSKGICVVPESLYCYHYKEAENLVNRFHENYYEALLYFRNRTWQCFRTLQAKQELYAEVNACFVGKSLMYLHKIYRDSGYEETRKYAELKRIGGSLPLQNALREYRATGKRRLLRELLLHKRFRLLDSLYRWR